MQTLLLSRSVQFVALAAMGLGGLPTLPSLPNFVLVDQVLITTSNSTDDRGSGRLASQNPQATLPPSALLAIRGSGRLTQGNPPAPQRQHHLDRDPSTTDGSLTVAGAIAFRGSGRILPRPSNMA